MNLNRAIFISYFAIAAAYGQTVSREYIRFNGSVVAIEGPDPVPALLSLSPINGSGPEAIFKNGLHSAIRRAQPIYSSSSSGLASAGANLPPRYLLLVAANFRFIFPGIPAPITIAGLEMEHPDRPAC